MVFATFFFCVAVKSVPVTLQKIRNKTPVKLKFKHKQENQAHQKNNQINKKSYTETISIYKQLSNKLQTYTTSQMNLSCFL